MQYRKLSELRKLRGNPRVIKDDKFHNLVESIRDNPKYFEARPLILSNRTGELVVIAGNQRYQAARVAGLSEVPTYLIEGITEDKEREITIRDNAHQGEWDFDVLASGWDNLPLGDWGVDLPDDWLEGLQADKEIKEPSEVAPRSFGDQRDEMSIKDLLNSVDLVKISFSGGKDSVATVIYIHNHYKIPKNKILLEHYYNPFEWHDIEDYCLYFSNIFGVELKTYGKDGAEDFMIKKIKEKGLPSVTNKWCFEKYKQRVFGKVAREYKKSGINYIQAVGIRAGESPRRAKMLDRGIIRDVQPFCYPIFALPDEEVFQMPINNNIKLHHAYRYFKRTGCPFCPMCPAKEFLILKEKYLDVWNRALELFRYSLECDFYRKTENNYPKNDLERIMGIGASKNGEAWTPPRGLEFWGY